MKVISVNVGLDGTGYSQFGNDLCLALDSVGVDVAVRPIKLATQYVEPPKRLAELCLKPIDGATHVIQNILPPYFSYRHGFKNIGLCHFEGSDFRPSNWQYYCNLLDELWVGCNDNAEAAKASGVKIPIKVVPKAVDKNAFCKEQYGQYDFGIKGRYAFLTVGDYSSRKNIYNLIKCYLEMFTRDDNVVLVVKSYVEGVSAQESDRIIREDINKLKMSLRRFGNAVKYPQIILITEYLSNEAMLALHAQTNCYISLERCAGYGLPTHEALAMGNWVVVNNSGGVDQFVDHGRNGHLIENHLETMEGMTRCPYTNMYTCHSMWKEPDYNQFKKYIRKAYLERPDNILRQEEFLSTYSYQNVGLQVKALLEGNNV